MRHTSPGSVNLVGTTVRAYIVSMQKARFLSFWMVISAILVTTTGQPSCLPAPCAGVMECCKPASYPKSTNLSADCCGTGPAPASHPVTVGVSPPPVGPKDSLLVPATPHSGAEPTGRPVLLRGKTFRYPQARYGPVPLFLLNASLLR